MTELHQGDVLKIERIKDPILVVSKDFFNEEGEVIGCPIFIDSTEGPLHVWISTKDVSGYVQCEKIQLLDLNVRGYSKTGVIELDDRMEISDRIQSIFEYI